MAAKAKSKLPWCTRCFGKGITKAGSRWVLCHCGRLLSSDGAAKMAKQEKLDKRLQEIQKGKW